MPPSFNSISLSQPHTPGTNVSEGRKQFSLTSMFAKKSSVLFDLFKPLRKLLGSAPNGIAGLIILLAVALGGLAETEAAETVTCGGKVMLRQQNGSLVPFPTGRVGATNEGRRMIDSGAIAADGSYQLTLEKNRWNTIQVLVRGYSFDPPTFRVRPQSPQQIALIIGTPTGGYPGAASANANQGTVMATLRPHPESSGRVSLNRQRFLVKDVRTNQLISTLVPDGRNQVRFSGTVGSQVIIEPRPNPGVSWTPSLQRVTITDRPSNVNFQYMLASEVGVGNLNLAKDRQEIPDALDAKLNGPQQMVIGHSTRFAVEIGRGAPRDLRYTFMVRHDSDPTWRTIGNLQRSSQKEYTFTQLGGLESKVVVFSAGVPVGSATFRTLVQSPPPPPIGVKLVGSNEGFDNFVDGVKGFFTGPDDLGPGIHNEIKFTIDQRSGQVGQPRRLNVNAFRKYDGGKKTQPLPRDGRRLTFLARHETDSEWRIIIQNSRTLEWNWTPPFSGDWVLRVDYVKNEENAPGDRIDNLRAQIDFTATSGPDSSGITTRPAQPLRPD